MRVARVPPAKIVSVPPKLAVLIAVPPEEMIWRLPRPTEIALAMPAMS